MFLIFERKSHLHFSKSLPLKTLREGLVTGPSGPGSLISLPLIQTSHLNDFISAAKKSVQSLTLLAVIYTPSVMDSCQLSQLVFIIHSSSSPARRPDREPEPKVYYSYLRKPLAVFSAWNLPGSERLDIFSFIVMAAALLCSDIWGHQNKTECL